jgi:hypothetical protein
MVIVLISNKRYTRPTSEVDFTSAANSIFRNILPATHRIQRFYGRDLMPASYNANKAKNLTQRYSYIFFEV